MKRDETPLESGQKFKKRFLCLKCIAYSILINMYLVTLIEITEAFPLDITPGLQLSERYIEDTDSTLNVRSTNYISTATASLQMVYQPVWFNLSGRYSISPSYESGDTQSSYLSQEGDFSLSTDRPRWSTALKAKLVSTRFIDQISEYNQVVVSPNNNYYQKSGSLSGSYSLTRISKISMTYSYTGNEYNSGSLYNSEIQSASSSLSYSLSPENQFIFSGSGNLYDYQNVARSKSIFAIADWSHTFGPFTSSQIGGGGGISSGYKRYILADGALIRKFKNGESRISYSRTISGGGGYTAVPLLNQQVSLHVSKTFSNQLAASMSGSLGESDSSYSNIDFNLRYWNTDIGLSYPLFNWLTGSLTYNHYDQKFNSVTEVHLISDQVMMSISSKILPWRF